ncbi:hypothetical protein GRF29_103g1513789 [Pseudopithomyces chartarum]|uniref:Phosphotransferase n=1 Tax=Pseudopithomyces chartarum TaxID=1892770 RepID=A0AAN6LYG8_9PLEO|nr:hypothetical protein GRF29_103g1513789 [Pseudopithomyces chartarum]
MSSSKECTVQDTDSRHPPGTPPTSLPPELEEELQKLHSDFWISKSKLKEIVQHFRKELQDGLRSDNQSIPMNLTWVPHLPTGQETGQFLTLDLGGTNLRICTVTLHGDSPPSPSRSPSHHPKKYTLTQHHSPLPPSLKTSPATHLWSHIATSLSSYLSSSPLLTSLSPGEKLPLGFTFSYPTSQSRIDHAVLQRWTKGFDIPGVEGHDVAAQLREALDRENLPVELICVVNDTVGALVASAYIDESTIVGAIFGTGSNAAYMAHASSIGKLRSTSGTGNLQDGKHDGKMAINCEYGAFDPNLVVLPRTKFDAEIDKASPRPGQQLFEKMSAGLYLGEIFRLVLLDLTSRRLLFTSAPPEETCRNLSTPYTIDTSFLSTLENDTSQHLTTSRSVFRSVLDLHASELDIRVSRRIAEMVTIRGARLSACGIAAI